MTFEEDLTKRRINVAAFAAGDPERYAAWRSLYEQVHPNTFYTSLKMIINDIRRQFWLEEVPKPAAAPTTTVGKPVMRRATGTVPSTASAIPDEPSPSVDRTPEPAPRTRPVIRRPTVTETAVPEEKELVPEKPLPTANEENSPETPKPGRARPVFRRPAAETPTSASAEGESKSEAKPEIASEAVNPSTDTAKPPRPRPVFRKPVTPEEKANETNTANGVPAEVNVTSLPEHSNPEPAEAPKPPRPRPVFKRPTSAAPPEPEKTDVAPESPMPASNPLDIQENPGQEKPTEIIAETPKSPRPRPIFKRPASASAVENPEIKATETKPEVNSEPTPTPETPEFPRPRPVMKRPVTPAEPSKTEPLVTEAPEVQNTKQVTQILENNGQEQALNEPSVTITPASESTEVPAVPKTPRPRPVFKRPSTSGPTTDTPSNKPETE